LVCALSALESTARLRTLLDDLEGLLGMWKIND